MRLPEGTQCWWCDRLFVEDDKIVLVKTKYFPNGIVFCAVPCWVAIEPIMGRIIPYYGKFPPFKKRKPQ